MSRASKRRGNSTLRIIGGQWRGRRLEFADAEGLRPTTDRVRETLFNWLAADIHGARCLDLFAGSGALGLEALSRGAGCCSFIDSSRQVVRQLDAHLESLSASDRAAVLQGDALDFLEGQPDGRAGRATGPWDIVFVDPPFGRELAGPACSLLQERRLLAQSARVYVETATHEPAPHCPANWQCHREKVAGGVAYRLYIVTAV